MSRQVYVDKEVTQKLRQLHNDRQWFNMNYELLKEQFNEMFVAVKDQGVVDYDEDLYALLDRITKDYPQNHRSIIIEHITDKRPIYIL